MQEHHFLVVWLPYVFHGIVFCQGHISACIRLQDIQVKSKPKERNDCVSNIAMRYNLQGNLPVCMRMATVVILFLQVSHILWMSTN